MKILIYRWSVFHQEDIADAFRSFGHTVAFYEESAELKKQPYAYELEMYAKDYDLVFSANYFSRVSDVCEKLHIKYVSWTVDSPMLTLYHDSVFHACNYIFIFDKFNYMQCRQMGVKQVYYLPLAVATERVGKLLANTPEAEQAKYDGEIAFVGGLYDKNSYDKIAEQLPPYLRGYFDACMEAQLDIFGENLFDRMLTMDILEQLAEIIDFRQDARSFSDIQEVFSATYLGFKMAQKERITVLNRLAKAYAVNVYTDHDDERLLHTIYKGTVSYREEMPLVFARSKVNLNLTIRNIRTGLPLRIWDVLGSGGFLLTNFQIELLDFFENGKDLVWFDSLADLQQKAGYYLKHEDERKAIAANGLENVRANHTYRHRIAQILDVIA